ncbi:sugar phosphate nucleotidyltransferase [Spongisporangium articulatum]|uniref:Sugar phosphate nucleotidyltransferase n=1 Tax=Spongisporangium articulatum TaxID=3362603 RepID=A0ABW8AQD6_9ACTN
MTSLAGVVLAAGAGTRLRPLTDLRPKALCPVGGVPLVDLALARLPVSGPDDVAVNVHHHAAQLVAHLGGGVHVSVESPEALGTAGALGLLRPWLDGRDVLVTNADVYLPGGLPSGFVEGWDGERSRLLCVPAGSRRADFLTPAGAPVRYVGTCLLPGRSVGTLEAVPSGLYEVLWRDASVDLVALGADAVAIDCGTVTDYLAANLHASGGDSVIGAGATVLGSVQRSVVWDGAWVGPDEKLTDVVRAGTRDQPVTARGSD